jgi:hypothetical protein
MKLRIAFVFCLLSIFFRSFALKDVYLTISHKLGDIPFAFNQLYTNNLGQSYDISRIDYYLSSIKITHDGGQIMELGANKHVLVKGTANLVNNLGSFDVDVVEAITFSVGVHPSLNNEDPGAQPNSSPLFFQSPSMHWGWASGYFFVCLEGTAGTSFISTYQFHCLWNENYFEQTIEVQGIENEDGAVYIHLDADYNEALKDVDVAAHPTHHGNNLGDLQVLQNFRDYVFSAGSGELLSAESYHNFNISIFPNPTNDIVNISFSGVVNQPLQIIVYDIYGRQVADVESSVSTTLDFAHLSAGVYMVQVSNEKGLVEQIRILKK